MEPGNNENNLSGPGPARLLEEKGYSFIFYFYTEMTQVV